MTSDAQDRTVKLISAAYGVAIKPERFDDFLAAWDDWFDALIENSEHAFAEVSPVFDDALSAASHLDATMPRAPLEQSPVPTVLLDTSGQIVAVNTPAALLFEEEDLDPVQVLSERRPTKHHLGSDRHRTFRMAGGPGRRSFLAVETQVTSTLKIAHPDACSALFLSHMDWNDKFEAKLAMQLDLSSAELRVARGLLEGRTAQEIAGDLHRSLPTIRSHIKALLQKTGARRQTELVQFLTILRQVSDTASSSTDLSSGSGFEQILLTGPAGRLQVVRYGMGQPMIYFTTSSCPEETEPFREAMAAAGFSVLAPVRPGFRESDPVTGDASDALLDDWLDTLVGLAGARPLIVGHREGGILAARAVQLLASKGEAVAGLALLSTGAPVTNLQKFEDTPASIRRSFLGAHIAAPALRLGYQAATRIFRTSTIGQNQIVRFFHKDSPADKRKLNDPVYHEITRSFLNYCFDNTDQIVRDVATWGSDWSKALYAATDIAPVLFIHGSEHVFHRIADIQTLTQGKANPSLLAIDGAGQLAIYEQPKTIAASLAALLEG